MTKKNEEQGKSEKPWWSEGVRFECQGSGKCCTSHGEFGFVFLTLKDRARMAKFLGLTTAEFTKKHCEKMGDAFHLIEIKGQPDCMFLKNKQCTVYEARPTQCRTWPFWPEVMSPKAWRKEVIEFCPGVGKGKLWTAEEIQARIAEQTEAEKLQLVGK